VGLCICTGGYTGEACDAEPTVTVVGNDLNNRAHPDGAARIEFVDTDMTFAAPGRIVSWDYFGTHRVPRAYCTVVLHVLRSPTESARSPRAPPTVVGRAGTQRLQVWRGGGTEWTLVRRLKYEYVSELIPDSARLCTQICENVLVATDAGAVVHREVGPITLEQEFLAC
jgi:hypothetical protein